MTALADLIPEAKALSRADKLRLIRVLADDLTDEAVPAGQSYPIWSPDSAFDAADTLLRALRDEARS
jgi:hypothetical protein